MTSVPDTSSSAASAPKMSTPNTDSILAGMQSTEGESALDFILRNTPKEPVPLTQAVVPAQAVPPKPPSDSPTVVLTPTPNPAEPPPSFEPPIDAPDDTPDDTDSATDSPDAPKSAAENIKRMRTALKETTKTLKEKETEAETYKKQLDDINIGLAQPKVLEDKEKEIEELRRYKYIVDFKSSPEYQEKIRPLNDSLDRLAALATDYEIPKEELLQELSNPNNAEVNRYLSEKFDFVGAQEVKGIVNSMRQIQSEVKSLEANSSTAIEKLRSENARIMEQKEIQRRESLRVSSRDAFAKQLSTIRSEGKIHELIMTKDDPEHNRTYVEPVLREASTSYGKAVSLLADAGLKELPPQLADWLAKVSLYAPAAAIAIQTRNHALAQLSEMQQNSERSRGNRPSIGNGAHGVSSPRPASASSPQEAAGNLLSTLGIKQ